MRWGCLLLISVKLSTILLVVSNKPRWEQAYYYKNFGRCTYMMFVGTCLCMDTLVQCYIYALIHWYMYVLLWHCTLVYVFDTICNCILIHKCTDAQIDTAIKGYTKPVMLSHFDKYRRLSIEISVTGVNSGSNIAATKQNRSCRSCVRRNCDYFDRRDSVMRRN